MLSVRDILPDFLRNYDGSAVYCHLITKLSIE
jgi:hypothetical protein